MAQIDLLLAAELLVVLLLVATLDGPSVQAKAEESQLDGAGPTPGWTAEADLHAQRVLRLERRNAGGMAAPLT